MSILDTLITNRVPGAAYGWQDLNRVSEAMEYVAARLTDCGYNAQIDTRRYTREDFPTETEILRYIEQLRKLHQQLTLLLTTPPVPGVSRDRPYMTVQEANDIERILLAIDTIITSILQSRLYAAQPMLYCGFAVYMTVEPKPVVELDLYTGELSVTYTHGYNGPIFEIDEDGYLHATYPDGYIGPKYTVDPAGYLIAE